MRIAVLGANGQVGAEVCLLLRGQQDVTLIPICRNRMGSAFLRHHGIAVRHGRAADEKEVAALIGDCDVVVNLALGSGTLREVADQNRRLIHNSIWFSSPTARVIFFSTVAVYGDPTSGKKVRRDSSYARDKLRGERYTMNLGRKADREVHVLRLGHVCGEFQNITALVREEIATGTVCLPDPDRLSNTVYTATIADAILKIGRGLNLPAVYDLLNEPQWTWRQVYEYEARVCGLPLQFDGSAYDRTSPHLSRSGMRTLMRALTASPVRKERAMQLIARLSPTLNERIQAQYYQARAAAEIATLEGRTFANQAVLWRPVGEHFMRCLTPTAELLESDLNRIRSAKARTAQPR